MLGLGLSFARQTAKVFSYVKDSLKAYFRFYDTTPDFLLDGSTSLSGSSQYIDCGTGLGNALGDNYAGDLTVSMWFKADVTSGDDGMFDIGEFANSSIGTFVLRMNSNTLTWITNWNRRINVSFTDTSSWHHVVGVYDSRGADFTKLYLDGVSVGTATGTFPSASDIDLNGFKTTIGGYYGTPHTFDGKIANVGIWSRSLSASEVESIYWKGSHSELKDTELTNLVSWYDLQGDVLDKQGSNDGTNNGATLNTDSYSGESPFKPRIQDKAATSSTDPLNYGELYSGRALDFDNSNDYVVVGSAFQDLFRGSHSISCWIKPVDGQPSDAGRFMGAKNTSGDFFYFSQFTSGKVSYTYASNGNGDGINSDFIFPDGAGTEWTHIVVLADSTNGNNTNKFKLYINGQLDTAVSFNDATITFSEYTSTEEVYIGTQGYNGNPSGDYWGGKISGIKFFNTLLTEAQIRELYTNPEQILPTGVSASNLKLDLPMQEGANSYVYDGSGNQNHGTIYGATWATGESDGYQSSLVRSNTPMHFDGANDLVAISNPLSSNWTFSIWARADFTDSGWHELYDKNPSSGGRITIAIVSNKFQMYDTAYRDSGYTLSDKNWHHYVITQTGTALNFYVDGSHQATVTGNGNSLGGDAHIGRYYPLAIEYWSGIINEVALYDTALDADAVTQLYGSGTPLDVLSDSGNYDNSSDLIGYWRNDGITTWIDRSTNSNNGTPGSATQSIVIPEGSTEGRDNQGFLLSDTTSVSNGIRLHENEHISLGKSEVLNNIFEGGGTFEAWIYAKGWGESDTGRIATKSNSNDIGWNIFIENGGRLYFRSDWSTTDMLRYATSAINLNQWHHIAITYNSTASAGTDPVIYVDGVSKTLSGTASAGTVVDDSPSTLEIGRRAGGGDREWDGSIDEVRIYDKALSSSEVTKNYNNGKSAHQ